MRGFARIVVCLFAVAFVAPGAAFAADEVVKIGLNYPKTGTYFAEGLDQIRAAEMAVQEINAKGGVLGKKIELVFRDSKTVIPVTKKNAEELIDVEKIRMLFGGSATSEAIAMGHVAQEKDVVFFGTLTYGNQTTGSEGHRHTFRECYNAWMGAKVMAKYMRSNFAGKKYYYVTANYAWGWTTEDSFRKFTGSTDKAVHKGVLTPFPTARVTDFKNALRSAQQERPEVLVLVEFGQDMTRSINIVSEWGMKEHMAVVVPNLTLAMAESAGPKNMAGVLGALPWDWIVPFKFNHPRGQEFVKKFSDTFGRYPSCSGSSAYTIVYEWVAAAERAKSFDAPAVIKALENHRYTLLKDEQYWRDFDHQSVQTVYAVRCNPAERVNKDKFKLDYFDIIDVMAGDQAVQTKTEWEAERAAAGKPLTLEKLPGE